MGKKPLLSIIVPIYKVERYLKKCIDSILEQDFSDFELILVDDGSPDKCGAICDEYAQLDSRIQVIHKSNGGVSSARNAALDIVQGKYISFIDSDDYISTDFYEANIRHLQEHPDIDMVVATIAIEEEKSGAKRPYLNNLTSCTKQGKESINDFLWSKYFLLLQSGVYRSSAWHNIRFPLGMVYEDSYVLPSLAENLTKISISGIGTYFYLKREGSITSSRDAKKMKDAMKVAFVTLDYLKQYPKSHIYNHRLLGYISLLLKNRSLLTKREYTSLMEQLRTYPLDRKSILFSNSTGWKEKAFSLIAKLI